METKEIYYGLVEKLDKLERITKMQKEKMEKAREAYELAKAELEKYESNVTAYRMAKEALEMGNFELEEKKTQEIVVEETVNATSNVTDVAAKKDTVLEWKHKTPYVIQIDKKGNQIGRFCSQVACARAIGWDQSSLSRFMKLDAKQQDDRKGFHFMWEH